MKSLSYALVTLTLTVSALARPTSLGLKTAKLPRVWREGFWAGCYWAVLAPRPYYAPAPVYVEPAPVYVEPPYRCYWTCGEPVWDDYRGIWRRPRVQVCD